MKKRKTCKPVKAWAVVDMVDNRIYIDSLFLNRRGARSYTDIFENVVRVEIREIRKASKGGGK